MVAMVGRHLPQNNNVVDITGGWAKDIFWMILMTLSVGRLSRVSFVDAVVHAFPFGFTQLYLGSLRLTYVRSMSFVMNGSDLLGLAWIYLANGTVSYVDLLGDTWCQLTC